MFLFFLKKNFASEYFCKLVIFLYNIISVGYILSSGFTDESGKTAETGKL
jgi:hypothetical protein